MGLYDIGTSHDPGMQQEPEQIAHELALTLLLDSGVLRSRVVREG
jgi:hypothetical protein